VVLLIAYLSSTSAGSAIGLISGTAGLMYVVLYVAGAIACIWFYRRTLLGSAKQFIVAGLLPFIGGAGLLFAAYHALPTLPHWTLYPFIVMFVAIWPAAWIVKLVTRAPFFDMPVVSAGADEPGGTSSGAALPNPADV
jgi:hypothetical protein